MKLVGMMSIALLLVIFSTDSHAISSSCGTDADLGTQICGAGGADQSAATLDDGGCVSTANLVCDGVLYPTFTCSPPITSWTPAILMWNDFSQGGDGGDPAECDEQYHDNLELIVALSTGWSDNESRCRKMIQIMSVKTRKNVMAGVVDECDSVYGCHASHAYQPPCPNNVVDGSDALGVL